MPPASIVADSKPPKTHYDTLGTVPTSDAAALRRAYLNRARKLHPDQFVDRPAAERARAERRMQELNAAWSVLSDPSERRAYDASLLNRNARRGTGPVVSGRDGGWKPFDPSEPPRPPRPKGPKVADEKDMEIRGAARLLRPWPILGMVAFLVLAIIVGTLATGGGSTTQRSVPQAEPTGVPLGCLSLGSVTEPVPCGDHDAVVWSVAEGSEPCPDGLESIYRQGIGGLYCVTRQAAP